MRTNTLADVRTCANCVSKHSISRAQCTSTKFDVQSVCTRNQVGWFYTIWSTYVKRQLYIRPTRPALSHTIAH